MKWVLIVWVMWTTADGEYSAPVKKAEVYYPTQQACVDAVFAIEQSYADQTKDGYGYTIECREIDTKNPRQPD